jgi:hypothetical protein
VVESSSNIGVIFEKAQTSVVEVTQTSASSQGSQTPLVGGVISGQATSYDGGDVDGMCMFSTADYTLQASSGCPGQVLGYPSRDPPSWP